METLQSYQEILARVDSFNTQVKEAKAKEAGNCSIPEKDPRNTGEKGIPNLDETDDTNKNRNDSSFEDKQLEDESTHPVSTGKNVSSYQDGNAKEDNFTSPTTPLSKIAEVNERVRTVTDRIQHFAGAAPASKTAGDGGQQYVQYDRKAANTEVASDYSDEFLRKLAFAIVETEGGLESVEPILLKHAGQEEARELMYKAATEYDQLVQLTNEYQQYEMEKAAYENEVIGAAEEMLKSASEDEREMIIKIAQVHDENTELYGEYDILKMAYMGGAGDAAAVMDEEAALPEEALEGGEEAGLPGAAQGEPSIEEIVQLLDAMVQAGEIDEETAAQVVEQLAGGGGEEEAMMGGGGEEEAMMAAMGGGGGEELPPELMGGGEEEGMIAQASVAQDVDELCDILIR